MAHGFVIVAARGTGYIGCLPVLVPSIILARCQGLATEDAVIQREECRHPGRASASDERQGKWCTMPVACGVFG